MQWLCEPLRVLILSIVMIYRSGDVADLVKCFVLLGQIGRHIRKCMIRESRINLVV
jgi:hypothetical protein